MNLCDTVHLFLSLFIGLKSQKWDLSGILFQKGCVSVDC